MLSGHSWYLHEAMTMNSTVSDHWLRLKWRSEKNQMYLVMQTEKQKVETVWILEIITQNNSFLWQRKLEIPT